MELCKEVYNNLYSKLLDLLWQEFLDNLHPVYERGIRDIITLSHTKINKKRSSFPSNQWILHKNAMQKDIHMAIKAIPMSFCERWVMFFIKQVLVCWLWFVYSFLFQVCSLSKWCKYVPALALCVICKWPYMPFYLFIVCVNDLDGSALAIHL